MSLEAGVQMLESRQEEWDKVLAGIEGTTALILKEQMDFKKVVHRRFEEVDSRFDKIEETLAIIVNHLKKP